MFVLNYIIDIFKKKLKYKIIFKLKTIIYLKNIPSFSKNKSFFPLLYKYYNSSPILISIITKIPTLQILKISITFIITFPSIKSFSNQPKKSSYNIILIHIYNFKK